MTEFETLNRTLFLLMNGPVGTAPQLVSFARLIADDAIYVIPIVLVLMWVRGSTAQRNVALKAVAVTFLALGVAQLIVHVWPHPRPFMLGLGHQWIDHAPDPSFPSDHMTVFASIGFTFLSAGMGMAGIVMLLLGLAVGWARIFLGVHFPFDMVGAIVLAGIVLALISPAWRRLGASLVAICEKIYRGLFSWAFGTGWLKP